MSFIAMNLFWCLEKISTQKNLKQIHNKCTTITVSKINFMVTCQFSNKKLKFIKNKQVIHLEKKSVPMALNLRT